MRYWLGPWEHLESPDTRPAGWNPPVGAVAVVDMRSRDEQSRTTQGSRPVGFFCGVESLVLPSEYTLLGAGDCREIQATGAMQDAWQSLTGYRPQGERLVDLLWDQLTAGAEPDAEGGPGPLVPGADGVARLQLAGHSVVKHQRPAVGLSGRGRWEAVLTAQLQRQFRRAWNNRGRNGPAEKVLGTLQAKYRLGAQWQRVVPQTLRRQVRGPRQPETSYSDDFNRADEDLNAGTWRYNTATSDYEVSSNAVRRVTGSGFYQSEYDADLSSDDHWAEVEWVRSPSNYGPCCRSQDPMNTGRDYYHTQRFGTIYISKVIGGAQTNLANDTAGSTSIGDVDRIQADGSTISGWINGTEDVSATDTTLSGQLRGGFAIHVTGATLIFDNFEESDIAAGGGGLSIPVAMRHYRGLRK